MKAFKFTLLFLDHDEVGIEEAQSLIENARLPNHISAGTIVAAEEADIGEWEDDHPLNRLDTLRAEFDRLFPAPASTESEDALRAQIKKLQAQLVDWAKGDRPILRQNTLMTARVRDTEAALAVMARNYAGVVSDNKALREELTSVQEELADVCLDLGTVRADEERHINELAKLRIALRATIADDTLGSATIDDQGNVVDAQGNVIGKRG